MSVLVHIALATASICSFASLPHGRRLSAAGNLLHCDPEAGLQAAASARPPEPIAESE